MEASELNRKISAIRNEVSDYVGSDEANCRLLDEMKNPDLNVGIRLVYRTAYRVWEVAWLNISVLNPDRRTAVALAYLKWKEGYVEASEGFNFTPQA